MGAPGPRGGGELGGGGRRWGRGGRGGGAGTVVAAMAAAAAAAAAAAPAPVLAGAGAVPRPPPSVAELGTGWVPAEPARDTPTVTNFWGAASTRHDLISVGALTLSPFMGNLLGSELRVGREVPELESHRWTACEAARRGATPAGARVETRTRLGFEQRLVVQRVTLSRAGDRGGAGGEYDVDITLGGPLARRCGVDTGGGRPQPWPAPTTALACGWGTPLPWNASEFTFDTDPASGVVTAADSVTDAWAGALVLEPGSGRRATGGVAPGGATFSLSGALEEVAVLVAIGESRGEVAGTLEAAAADLEGVWTAACDLWEERWNQAFQPRNAHFSGNLPTLTVDTASDPDGDLERAYYAAALAVVAMERTNLNLYERTYVISEGQPIFYQDRTFTNGGAGQFTWDLSCAAASLSLLDPEANRALVRHVARYADLAAEPLGLPQAWDAFQQPPGVAPGRYAFDYIATWDLFDAHLRYTEDWALLSEPAGQGASGHGAGSASVRELLRRTAWSHSEFPALSPAAPWLADYGGDVTFFLEVVPPYVHAVPALQFSSARMLRGLAELERAAPPPAPGHEGAARDAESASEAIASQAAELMYVVGSGAFASLYPDGSAHEVRTAADAAWIARAMGVLVPLPGPGSRGALPQGVLREVADRLVEAELYEEDAGWFRGLSKLDPFVQSASGTAALGVLRADWGTSGAYASLPAMLAEVYVAADGDFDRFVKVIRRTAEVSRRGTLGQGTAVEAPAAFLNYTGGPAPDAPFQPNFPEFFPDGSSWPSTERAITVAAGATVDAVVRTLFGYQPPLGVGGCRAPGRLLRANVPRPIHATLAGLNTPCGVRTLRVDGAGVRDVTPEGGDGL